MAKLIGKAYCPETKKIHRICELEEDDGFAGVKFDLDCMKDRRILRFAKAAEGKASTLIV